MSSGKAVLWVGPFPVELNGIDEYATKILSGLRRTANVTTAKLHFSNWKRDYPLQAAIAMARVGRAALRRPRPVVHIQHCPFSTGPASLLIAAEARLLGLRVITTVHEERSAVLGQVRSKERAMALAAARSLRASLLSRLRPYERLYPWVEDRLLGLSQAIIVHSRGQMERLPPKARRKAAVVEFGVDEVASSGAMDTRASVGCFGMIAPHKGIETVIDACEIALQTLPQLKLRIAGTVPETPAGAAYLANLCSLAEQKLGERVEILVNLPDPAFDEAFASVSVVCFGLQRVTQSTSFYRALAHHKPVIVTDVGGVAEVVKREGAGLVVPVSDPGAMSIAITRLSGNQRAYRAAQRAAKRYARERTWAANAQEHLALYEKLAG